MQSNLPQAQITPGFAYSLTGKLGSNYIHSYHQKKLKMSVNSNYQMLDKFQMLAIFAYIYRKTKPFMEGKLMYVNVPCSIRANP